MNKDFIKKNFTLIATIVSILTIASFIYFAYQARSIVIYRILSRQQILADAYSTNIKTFFEDFSASVSLLSQSTRIRLQEEDASTYLDTFVNEWEHSGVVTGIAMTNSSGTVIFNSNIYGTHDLGGSLADREYFSWAKNSKIVGDSLVADPLISRIGASKGRVIIPVISPIFRNGSFVGALIASVDVDRLTDRYIDLVKTSDNVKTYIINLDDKKLFYDSSLQEDRFLSGESFDKYEPFIEDQRLSKFINSNLENEEIETLVTKNYLTAFSTIKNGQNNWLLVVTSTAGEVGEYSLPIYLRVGLLAILVGVTAFVFGRYDPNKT